MTLRRASIAIAVIDAACIPFAIVGGTWLGLGLALISLGALWGINR